MIRSRRFTYVTLSLVTFAALGVAHVRLQTSTGNPLRWSAPANISIVVQSDGSDDIPDQSDELAVRMAIEDWNAVSGTSARLVENTTPAQQARTDYASDNIHLVMFDELNASGYFGGNGIVAITPLWFFLDGRITDADIIFNGDDFDFTTSGAPGAFDIQDVAAHELGHLLGLDHSGWASGTMYPYVDPTVVLHRSLSEDEVRGLRHAYPQGGFGRITGRILRASDGTGVQGAHVVALDDEGRTDAAILSSATGNFDLRGLEPGTYTIYASPLDSPVGGFNLGGITVETDFEATVHGTMATITGTNLVGLGDIVVGADVALNLGTSSDIFPIRAERGTGTSITLRGNGLFPGSTLTASDPDVVLSAVTWFGSQVSFLATVPSLEPLGHFDLTVTNASGDVSILTAGIEITPPAPVVTGVIPVQGSTSGGTPVTIQGTDFVAGSRVVIGDVFYTDGIDATVEDDTTITLVTRPTLLGTHDVVVIDPSGSEDRVTSAFQTADLPAVTTVFPDAGQAAGGTEVSLTGSNLQAGAIVRLNGVVQSSVEVEDGTTLTFSTQGGPAGAQTLEVENPGGGIATAAFAYAVTPDPELSDVSPASGKPIGGETLTLTGTDFPTSVAVFFGVDPVTGEGGIAAASVNRIDATTIEVVTPEHPAGPSAIVVRDAASAQAAVLSGVFAFRSSSSGGGGSCRMVPVSGPPDVGRVLLGGWWMLLLAAALGWRARQAAFRAPAQA